MSGPDANEAAACDTIRVLVADDHPVVRQGLVLVVNSAEGIETVGEASDGIEACEQTAAVKPHVVLMDISMPRLSGIEATRRIAEQHPHVRIIGLSLHDEDDMAVSMKSAGASEYLLKDGPPEALIAAIRRVAGGG